MLFNVIRHRRDVSDKQIRLAVPLDPLDLPDLPTLKEAIRVAKEECSSKESRATHAHSLMAVEGPVDLIDQLGGWSAKSVGISYGDGYDLQSTHNCVAQLAMHR